MNYSNLRSKKIKKENIMDEKIYYPDSQIPNHLKLIKKI